MPGTLLLKNGVTTTDPRLDRVEEFDDLSKNFPIRTLLPPKGLRSYTWQRSPQLDQGNDGACVGFGHTGRRGARPKPHPEVDNNLAFDIYHEAQELDEWPGHDYDGTSVLAGAKAMKARGFYKEYRWGFSIDDALMALSHHGPVVFGFPWMDSMFTTDPNGFLDISGKEAGGHCIYAYSVILKTLANGFKLKEPAVRLGQSWGWSFGIGGTCLLYASDVETLLNKGGETCVPVE